VDYVEEMCLKYRPRFVVIDQGDKLHYKGEGKAGNGADRLKGVYVNLREIVKRCSKDWKIDILTVGQADAKAEGQKKLFQSNLDSGKTGKAGEFDYIIGIGYSLKDSDQAVRFFSCCKNKLGGDHKTRPVNFDAETGRYSD
jgi:hypothetical protein